jgi:hypothetical protein
MISDGPGGTAAIFLPVPLVRSENMAVFDNPSTNPASEKLIVENAPVPPHKRLLNDAMVLFCCVEFAAPA